jgi:hypothetical protein
MYSDILTVLGVPLIMSVLKPLNLLVSTEVNTAHKAAQLAQSLIAQVGKVRGNGFEVETIFVDGEAPLVAAGLILEEYRLQIIQVGTGEHVMIIERAIRLVKERVRCLLVDLPWHLPKGWVRYLVYYVVSRINSLPRMSGTGLSARDEFRGRKLSYIQDLTLCFEDGHRLRQLRGGYSHEDPIQSGKVLLRQATCRFREGDYHLLPHSRDVG